MRLLSRHSNLARFVAIFALAYGLLIAPWPGWNTFYASYYRGLCAAVLPRPANLILLFERNAAPLRSNLSSSITIGNRANIDSQGRFHAVVLQADTRSIAWMPTAMVVALIGATQVSCRRKLYAFTFGLIAIHAYILFITGIWILNRSTDVAAVTLLPWQKHLATMLEYTFVEQIGASFVVPVIIWFLVTFHAEDLVCFWQERNLSNTELN